MADCCPRVRHQDRRHPRTSAGNSRRPRRSGTRSRDAASWSEYTKAQLDPPHLRTGRGRGRSHGEGHRHDWSQIAPRGALVDDGAPPLRSWRKAGRPISPMSRTLAVGRLPTALGPLTDGSRLTHPLTGLLHQFTYQVTTRVSAGRAFVPCAGPADVPLQNTHERPSTVNRSTD